jgi:hypothetical protein
MGKGRETEQALEQGMMELVKRCVERLAIADGTLPAAILFVITGTLFAWALLSLRPH